MKKGFKFLGAGVILLVIYFGLSISPVVFTNSADKTKHENINVIAHRGASKFAPENTMAAVKLALNSNAAYIEIDVHQTLDSTLILMHDESLDRTTNGSGLIKDKTYAEMQKLDAGKWFSEEYTNEKVPTLESVMQLVNGRANLIIEIKKGNDYYPGIEQNIIKIIRKYKAENWVVIHSFHSDILKKVHAIAPDIKLHKLIFAKFKFVPFIISKKPEILDMDELDFVDTYSINYFFTNKEIINLLKSKGKKINVWTVDDPQTAKELIALGIDGIITNNPAILKEISTIEH